MSKCFAERLSLQQFRDDKRRAGLSADVVHHENVWMIECGRGARFLLEPAEAITIGGKSSGNDLDCHLASEARIARAIDLAHAPDADDGEDFIRAETGAGWEGQP